MNEFIGKKVDHYELLGLLGKGGMGAVYEAKDNKLGRKVALKLLLNQEQANKELSDEGQRLQDEAKAASKLQLAHLVHVLDVGHSEELGPYIVYELLPGPSLKAFLETRGPLAEDAMERLIRPLLQTLQALHDAGIVHRDVKPENLLAGPDGIFKLADLGLAFFEGRQAHTKTGFVLGSPGYLAPEVFAMGVSPGPKQDCYSAAVVIAEALSGKRLFARKKAAQVVKEQFSWRPEVGKLSSKGVPNWAAPELVRALQQKPDERPSAEELLNALTRRYEAKNTPTVDTMKKPKQSQIPQEGRSLRSLVFLTPLLLLALLYTLWSLQSAPLGRKQELETVSALAVLPQPEELVAFLEDTEKYLRNLRSERPHKIEKLWRASLASHPKESVGKTLMMAKRKISSGEHFAAFRLFEKAQKTIHQSILKEDESLQAKLLPLETVLFSHIYLICPVSDKRKSILKDAMQVMQDFSLAVRHSQEAYDHYRHLALLVALKAAQDEDLKTLLVSMPSVRLIMSFPPSNGVVAELTERLLQKFIKTCRDSSTLNAKLKEKGATWPWEKLKAVRFRRFLELSNNSFNSGRNIYSRLQKEFSTNIAHFIDQKAVAIRKTRCTKALERAVWTSNSLSFTRPDYPFRLPGHTASQIYTMLTEVLPLAKVFIGEEWTGTLSRPGLILYGVIDLERLGLLVANTKNGQKKILFESLYAESLLTWFRIYHQTQNDLEPLRDAIEASSSNAPTHFFARGCLLIDEGKEKEGFSLQQHGFSTALDYAVASRQWGERWSTLARIATWRWALLRRAGLNDVLAKESAKVLTTLDSYGLPKADYGARRFAAVTLVTLGHAYLRLNEMAKLEKLKVRMKALNEKETTSNVLGSARELCDNRAIPKSLYLY